MAPSEEERFAAAEKLWISGDARAAVQVHVELSYCAQNPDIRLRSAIALIERLNPAWDVDIILDACSTGIEMAEKLGERETRAHLMPMRAKNLAVFNGSLVTTRKNLKLTPNWLGFSL
jgi:hypothetical protein